MNANVFENAVVINGLIVINLCKHSVAGLVNGEVMTFPAVVNGKDANVSVKTVNKGTLGGFALVGTEFGEVKNLPEPIENTVFIVNGMVFERCSERKDIIAPDSGPSAIRENGQVKHVIQWKTHSLVLKLEA